VLPTAVAALLQWHQAALHRHTQMMVFLGRQVEHYLVLLLGLVLHTATDILLQWPQADKSQHIQPTAQLGHLAEHCQVQQHGVA
jgi:hypothetical protein